MALVRQPKTAVLGRKSMNISYPGSQHVDKHHRTKS